MNTVIDKKTAIETMIRCVVVAQSKGVYTIKDGALLYKVILFLRGGEDKDLEEKNATDALVRAVVLGNSKGVYTLEEISLINKVIIFLSENNLITTEQPKEEQPSAPQPKVVEI